MEALLETTVWKAGTAANHTYLLDGTNLVAYIKAGSATPFYFKNPIKGFDKAKRTFRAVKPNPFKITKTSATIEVQGSKGQTYYIDPEAKTCTCSGFTFRGTCKHIKDL